MNEQEKQTEKWASISGGRGRYEISSLGRIRSLNRRTNGHAVPGDSIMNQEIHTNGYRRVQLSIGQKRRKYRIHRLVAEAFIPNPEGKPQVNHINGDKADNRVENLEWCYAHENTRHSIKNGFQKTKLNDFQVRVIRRLSWYMTPQEISRIFHVGPGFLREILHGERMNIQRVSSASE